jgi:hypothetical protein
MKGVRTLFLVTDIRGKFTDKRVNLADKMATLTDIFWMVKAGLMLSNI